MKLVPVAGGVRQRKLPVPFPLPPVWTLSFHDPVFPDLDGRIGGEIPRMAFRGVLTGTLAHRDCLALEGRAERVEGEDVLYGAA